MKNGKIIKVLATGVLVAGLAVSLGGGMALADSGSAGAANVAAGKALIYSTFKMSANQDAVKEALADLVTAGTITQDQSDAVLTCFQQNLPSKPVIESTAPANGGNNAGQGGVTMQVVDPMKNLVDQGTITEDQAQAIRDKMRDITNQQMQQQWQTGLNSMVGNGTITQDQADKVLAFLEANQQKMQSVMDQVKDMSQDQRAQYLKENLGNIQDPVSQMVSQGIINQQQADALKQAVPSLPTIVRWQKLSSQQIQTNLDALASAGTITQDQAGKIEDFMASNDQKVQVVLDQVKSADAQQVVQNPQSIKGGALKDPVSKMVSQGIITQQQADAVREAVMGSASGSAGTSESNQN